MVPLSTHLSTSLLPLVFLVFFLLSPYLFSDFLSSLSLSLSLSLFLSLCPLPTLAASFFFPFHSLLPSIHSPSLSRFPPSLTLFPYLPTVYPSSLSLSRPPSSIQCPIKALYIGAHAPTHVWLARENVSCSRGIMCSEFMTEPKGIYLSNESTLRSMHAHLIQPYCLPSSPLQHGPGIIMKP